MQRSFLFQAFANTGWFWFSLACCLVAAALIVTLLRYERRLVSRRVGLTLLSLRLSTIAVLFMTFLEPVVSSRLDRTKAGRIVVAVDVSESMTTSDRYASKSELLRWARAVEMIGNAQINERLDTYQQAFDAGVEPQWVLNGETNSDSKRDALTKLRSEEVAQVLEQVRSLPRNELVRRFLAKTSKPLLAELADVGAVDIRIFGSQSESIEPSVAVDSITTPPSAIGLKQSDLALALDIGNGDSTAQLTGVVLITDGRHNGDRDPVLIADRVGAAGIPVIPVMIGSEQRPRDISIVSVDAPQVVFKDDSSVVKARLTLDGFEHEIINVALEMPDGTNETKSVKLAGKNAQSAEVEFNFKATEIGHHRFTLRTDVRPHETRDGNNSREFSIQVVDDKSRVLLVDGEARWEFRFIHAAYERDERIELTPVVFNQPYIGVLPEPFFSRRIPTPQPGPHPVERKRSVLGNYDLVIIGDVSPQQFGDDAWNILEDFVREDGGSIVLLAGKNHFPKEHKAPSLARMFPMRELRLVDLAQQAAELPSAERGLRFRLTPDGEKQTMFQLVADAVENRNIWNQMPGHVWGILGEARPGTTVFATARWAASDNLNDEQKNALAVHQYYGFGQILWLGLDSTWRWRHRVGDKYHHRFWGQLARWAAENKASAGNSIVRLSLRENPKNAGSDAVVQTRWDPRFLEQHSDLKAFVEVFQDDTIQKGKPLTRQPLVFVDGKPFTAEARLNGLASGTYRLRIIAEDVDLGTTPVETTLYVQEPQTGELSDLSANRELLTKIATAARSRVVLPDQIHEIAALIQPPSTSLVQQSETTLFDHWLTLWIFFLLLTVEWVVRKLCGLP